MASCPLLYIGLVSSNFILTIVIHLSLECKSMVLHIMNLISQLILPWVVYSVINLVLYSLWLLLHKPWCSIYLEYIPFNLFCDPILFVLAICWISFCWINRWIVKYISVNPLDWLDSVLFLCPVILFPYHPLTVVVTT